MLDVGESLFVVYIYIYMCTEEDSMHLHIEICIYTTTSRLSPFNSSMNNETQYLHMAIYHISLTWKLYLLSSRVQLYQKNKMKKYKQQKSFYFPNKKIKREEKDDTSACMFWPGKQFVFFREAHTHTLIGI